jgi:hypothetical protein
MHIWAYFVCLVKVVTVGEEWSKVALTAPSYEMMIVMVFCPTVERD